MSSIRSLFRGINPIDLNIDCYVVAKPITCEATAVIATHVGRRACDIFEYAVHRFISPPRIARAIACSRVFASSLCFALEI